MASGADSGPREQQRAGDLLDTPLAGPAAIQGSALRVGGYAIGVLLSVGSSALLFRHLGVADAGRFVTALSLVTIAGGLSDLGLTTIALRELSVRDQASRERFVRSLLGLRTVLTGAGVVSVVMFTLVAGYPRELVAGTGLAGVGLVILNIQGTLATGLMVELRLGWVTVAELLRQVVTVISIVGLVVAGAELLPFLAVAIPSSFAALALTALLIRGDMPFTPSFDRTEWATLLRDVLPFAAASVLGIIYFRVAIVLLSLVSTTKQTGYFSVSFRMLEVLVVIPQLLVSGAFPIFSRAARDDHARLAYGVQRTFEASLVLGVGVGLALILGAPLAIEVIAGPDFDPSIGILRIQAIALIAVFVNVAWVYALLSLRRNREILLLSLLGVTLNVASVAIFGSLYGARGAAWATTIVDVVQTALVGVCLARVNPMLRPSLAVLPRVALAGLAAGALALVPGIPTAALVALAGATYIALAVLLRAVPEETIADVRSLMRRRAGNPPPP